MYLTRTALATAERGLSRGVCNARASHRYVALHVCHARAMQDRPRAVAPRARVAAVAGQVIHGGPTDFTLLASHRLLRGCTRLAWGGIGCPAPHRAAPGACSTARR